jgi:hypothetical protein
MVKKCPAPGNTSFAKSCALFPLAHSIRQIFNCAPMSSNIEMRITNPKLANNLLLNTAVCVRNPGPIADVAIKKAAAISGDENILFFNGFN